MADKPQQAQMEARAIARYVRMTPRKMRLVADLVRGRNINDAVNILQFSARRASTPVEKAIRSALANLQQTDEGGKLDPSEVIVKTIFVDEGPTMRRFMPRAMGRAYRIRKKTCHLTVVVASTGKTLKAKSTKPLPVKKETPAVSEPAEKAVE